MAYLHAREDHGGGLSWAALRALRERAVGQERADARDARQAVLPVQRLRPAFTNTPARGKPMALKAAVLLFVSGLSMNRTAKRLGVSTPTVQAWLEQFAAAYPQKPE